MVSDETDAISVFSDRPEEIDSKSEYAQKLLEDEILHGNHSAGGKFRITEYISDNSPTNDEFAKFLKNEYGIGGGSRSGIVKFSNHDGKGLALILGNNGNEQTVRFGWKVVAKAIRKAVDEGRYITERILNQPAVIRSLTQSILQFTMSISTVLKIAGFNLSARILSAPDWIFRSGSHLNCSPLMRKSIFVLSRTSRRNIRKSSAVP